MIKISCAFLMTAISLIWLAVRGVVWIKTKRINAKRELQLLTVYVCIVVVARITCFPFERVNGAVQPLVFDPERLLPLRVNLVPFVNMLNYPTLGETLRNVVGNTVMFMPLGIVWPSVFNGLNSHKKVVLSGFLSSLFIEIFQLPFYERSSDVDDLILNTLGFVIGYLIYLAIRRVKHKSTDSVN